MKWTNQAVNRSTSNYLSHLQYSHKSINLNSIQAGISQGIYTLILITLIKLSVELGWYHVFRV